MRMAPKSKRKEIGNIAFLARKRNGILRNVASDEEIERQRGRRGVLCLHIIFIEFELYTRILKISYSCVCVCV